jgi:hypothetical protein
LNALPGVSSAPRIVFVCFPLVEPLSSTRLRSSHCSTDQNHLLYQWELGLMRGYAHGQRPFCFFFGRFSINLNYS